MSCCDASSDDLTPFGDALAAALAPINQRPSESVPYEEALGRVLATAITTDRDLPACTRSRMDGYALRAADYQCDTPFDVVGEVRAGDTGKHAIPTGACVKIATGAPLPDTLDTVIEHEQSDRGTPVQFSLPDVQPGRAVHLQGVDARKGDCIIAAGTRIGPEHIGLATTVGATTLEVTSLPRTLVVSSGDELVPAHTTPEPHQIREGNAPMIQAALHTFGAGQCDRMHLADDEQQTMRALDAALKDYDLIITIGGISAGEHDFIRPSFEALNVQWMVARANIKPGRPVHVGQTSTGTLVCCLPGNPVSALVCAHLFVRPMINTALGVNTDTPWRPHTLRTNVTRDHSRWSFRPARLEPDGTVHIPAWQGSGDLAHVTTCTGILEVPPGTEPCPAGSELRFLDWRT